MARQLNHLFDHNPPTESGLIKALFCDREDEQALGMELLRSTPPSSKIYAVHGMPRSGKSHLVHLLLHEAEQIGLPYYVLRLNANNRGTAKAALEKLFWVQIEPSQAHVRQLSPMVVGRGGPVEGGWGESVLRSGQVLIVDPLDKGVPVAVVLDATQMKQGLGALWYPAGAAHVEASPDDVLDGALTGTSSQFQILFDQILVIH